MPRRRVLLVQLPIPPLGPGPIRGNIPLAAAYLKMFAENQGLGKRYDIELFPPPLANRLGDRELAAAILERDPWVVGFTCYLWNIDRTLWLAEQLKVERPDLVIILGGPEVTLDNEWVLEHPAVDGVIIGEGEQTFAEWLADPMRPGLPGWLGCGARRSRTPRGMSLPMVDADVAADFTPRTPLRSLDPVASPYLAGILDAADEGMMLLETLRGCVFKCKFCYYPKSYDDLHYLSEAKIAASLEYARRRGVGEVVLLDPTLNQGRNFDDFLRLLGRHNPDRQFTYFGELRAEGITPTTARLLRHANFTEVEVGLQSIDPRAMELMDRKNNLRAVERGLQALRGEGIRVKVDLIIGLPGDTVESVRRSFDYVRSKAMYDDVQVFNLAVLPGTAFRHEAAALGLVYQPRPPYYVRRTPTLQQTDLFCLMHEAEQVFETDWDPLPEVDPATLQGSRWDAGLATVIWFDLDRAEPETLPPRGPLAQALTLGFTARDFPQHRGRLEAAIRGVLRRNPFTTLQVVLDLAGPEAGLPPSFLGDIGAVLQAHPTYLDRYYAMQPGRPIGAKRLVVLADASDDDWREAIAGQATLLPRRPAAASARGEACAAVHE